MPLTDGLEVFWPLETDSTDATGNGHNGTDTGVTYGPGYVEFDGSGGGDYINFTAIDLYTPNSEYTFACEVYPQSAGGSRGTLIGMTTGGWFGMFIAQTSPFGPNTPRWEHYIFGSIQGATDCPTDTWSHVVFTYDNSVGGGDWKIYVNGTLSNSGNDGNIPKGSFISPPAFNRLGKDTNYQLLGRMRNAGGWLRALDASEVAALYASPNPYAPTPIGSSSAFNTGLNTGLNLGFN